MPGPVFNNTIEVIANLDWKITRGDEIGKELNLKRLALLNDFVVNGYGIQSEIIEGVDYIKLNDKIPDNGPIAMIGAGTGLGHGYLVKADDSKYYQGYPSEGGHQDFAPQTPLQWRYLLYLQKIYKVEHISVERACSGPVMIDIMYFFIEQEKRQSDLYKTLDDLKNIKNEDIIQNALNKKCKVCMEVIDFFVEIYGAAAGNISLLMLPTGGVYLLGGLSIALEVYLRNEKTFIVILLLIFQGKFS
jgi:glucokinase